MNYKHFLKKIDNLNACNSLLSIFSKVNTKENISVIELSHLSHTLGNNR